MTEEEVTVSWVGVRSVLVVGPYGRLNPTVRPGPSPTQEKDASASPHAALLARGIEIRAETARFGSPLTLPPVFEWKYQALYHVG